ncbi:MAG TPA: TlpA family protein disulfide reductase [Clostridiaceae bacterium]|nr:TlpA family protein disulfide reductase [Clostridiaceae bacterium]
MNIAKKKRTMMTMVCVAVFLVSLLSTCTACRKEAETPEEPRTLETNALGHSKAPEFELTDQFGTTHRLSDYRGKIVYLNFWATWCDLCCLELPDLEQVYQDRSQNQSEVVVLGVVLPSETSEVGEEMEVKQEKSVEELKAFLTENGLTFPVLMDVDGKTFVEYAITGLPTTYLIDREGFFVGVIPASIDKELMDRFIEEALLADNGLD